MPSGSRAAVTTLASGSSGPKRSSPSAGDTGPGGAGEDRVALEDVVEALGEDLLEGDVERRGRG